jgi:hypothetical protein
VIRFFIDPQHVKQAVLSGGLLMVEIHGDRYQFQKVSVVNRPGKPIKPSDEAEAA